MDRIAVGTQLRPPLKRQLDEEVKLLGGRLGIKQAIIEAALYGYFSQPEAERRASVQRVLSSETPGGAEELVRDAQLKAKLVKPIHGKPLNPRPRKGKTE